MYYWNRFKKKVNNYFYDHPFQKGTINYVYAIIVTAISAICFSFGFIKINIEKVLILNKSE